MKVVGLDGREYAWKLAGYTVRGDDERPRSSYHLAARGLLKKLFSVDAILEEVPLPGMRTTLYADFVLPLRRIVVEVHGEQHYSFVQRFHGDVMGYLAARGRDVDKKRWCQLNDLSFVELPFDKDENEWTKRILDAHG